MKIGIIESSKWRVSSLNPMTEGRVWILYITAIVCIALVFVSNFMYPLNEFEIVYILAYDLAVILGILGIIRLVQKRALEDW